MTLFSTMMMTWHLAGQRHDPKVAKCAGCKQRCAETSPPGLLARVRSASNNANLLGGKRRLSEARVRFPRDRTVVHALLPALVRLSIQDDCSASQ
jgi:hypothetical protein